VISTFSLTRWFLLPRLFFGRKAEVTLLDGPHVSRLQLVLKLPSPFPGPLKERLLGTRNMTEMPCFRLPPDPFLVFFFRDCRPFLCSVARFALRNSAGRKRQKLPFPPSHRDASLFPKRISPPRVGCDRFLAAFASCRPFSTAVFFCGNSKHERS